MADDVTYTAGANATPPDQTKATTDETSAGPHSVGSHMGVAKLAVSADGDSTHIPATAADGLLVEVSNAAGIPVVVPEPLEVEGDAAHDAPVSGNPVLAGGKASDAPPAPVSADGDAADLRVDRSGNLAVRLVDSNGNLMALSPSSGGVPIEAAAVLDTGEYILNAGDAYQNIGVAGSSGLPMPISDDGGSITVDGAVTLGAAIPAGNNNIGDVDIASLPNEGQQTMANSISVAIASDQSAIPVSGTIAVAGSATATLTQVADNAADVQLLASNASREKYSVTNDSTVALYLADGATAASTTNYTVQIPPNGFYSNSGYTGEVRGIWASDPGTGAARLTEYT